MHVLTWNFARHAPGGWQTNAMVERIGQLAPDVICLTEAHETSLARMPGHTLSSRGSYWSASVDSERKVLLWSKAPWTDAQDLPAISAISGVVSAVTEGPLGPVRVVGVCIPYHMASPFGAEERAKPWSIHMAYLDALAPALHALRESGPPVIVVGDFNQRVPAEWGVHEVRAKFDHAFAHFDIVTRGDVPGIGEPSIDHIAVTRELRAKKVLGLARFDAEGKPMSDHFGVCAELEAGGVQIFD
jgi:endonuclease/exonuclease/phosphatase family metal-dependent hydrolase